MSEEQLKALLEKARGDTNLLAKLKAADANSIVGIAKEAGYNISKDDLKRFPLSEEELESTAGGAGTPTITCGATCANPTNCNIC